MQHRGIVERDRLAERVAHPPGRRDRFRGVSIGLVPVFAVPRQMGEVGAAKDADVRPGEQRQYGFRGAAVRADGRGHMVERRFQLAQMKQAASQDEVPRQHQTRSRLPFRHSQKFEAELPRFFQIAPHGVKDPDAAQNHENIAIVEPSRKIQRPLVSFAHFRRGVAFRRHQRRTQRDQQIQFLFQPAVRLGKSPAQRQGAPQQVRRFRVRISLPRISSRPPVVLDRLFRHSGLFEMRGNLPVPAFDVGLIHFGQRPRHAPVQITLAHQAQFRTGHFAQAVVREIVFRCSAAFDNAPAARVHRALGKRCLRPNR